MLVKANIKVYGNVQAVGYRVFVKSIARIMNVRGLARNLEDGSVEIFAEAEENTLEKFLKAIDVKGRPGDILSLNVDRVEVKKEGETGYTGPWREYNLFEIDYGEEVVRPVEREIVESLEWAKLYFTKLVSEFTDYRGEFRNFREEFRDYREEFRDFRGEFRNFREEFRDYRNEFRSFVDEFRDYKSEFRDFREEFRDYRQEFRDFRDESLKISGEILSELKNFRDESLKMNRQILDEVRELRRDLKTILDERLTRMEKDIAEIKAKIGLI